MRFTESISVCFRKYAKFEGRASRSEFWYFHLFIIISYGALLTLMILSKSEIFIQLFPILILGSILPSYAVTARRLHDVNKSGFFQLLPLPFLLISNASLPFAFLIFFSLLGLFSYFYLLFLYCKKGEIKDNNYGLNIY